MHSAAVTATFELMLELIFFGRVTERRKQEQVTICVLESFVEGADDGELCRADPSLHRGTS